MIRCIVLILCLGIILCSSIVGAIPFDVVVPETINMDFSLIAGFDMTWGWLIATTEVISEYDIWNGTIGSNDTVQGVVNVNGSLVPGQVRSEGSPYFNYQSLLYPGETLVDISPFWVANVFASPHVPSSFTSSGSARFGDDIVYYSTQINVGDFDYGLFVKGQRLSSVSIPEPSTLFLLSGGLIGLGVLRKRLR